MHRSLVSSFAVLSLVVSSMLFVPLAHSQTVEAVATAARPSVAAILATRSDGTLRGTGFMAADRLVITTYHLVMGATRIVLKFPDYPEVEARVVQGDSISDVAVLTIPALPVRPLPLGDIAQVREGQTIVVIGFPFLEGLGTAPATVTKNTVSTVRPPIIQMQASVTPSNSGGPVLNVQGEVVGIADATPKGDFATATAINAAKPLLGAAVLAPAPPPPSVSAAPAQPGAARSATIQHPNPGLEIEGWSFTGNVTYHTTFQSLNLSELNFPTAGTMPLVRLSWHPIVLRYGSTSLNAATSTDNDFGDIFGLPGVLVNQTHQSQTGNANLFTGDFLLGNRGSDAQFFVGYESHSYNFTWTGPFTCSIPTCFLTGPSGGGTGAILTYGTTYNGPRIGVTGDWKLSDRASLSANLGYGFITMNALDTHILRNVTFPQSGNGYALLGEVALGYNFTDDLSVRVGYQYLSINTSGTDQFCSPAGVNCVPNGNLTNNATNQGVTAGVLWKF